MQVSIARLGLVGLCLAISVNVPTIAEDPPQSNQPASRPAADDIILDRLLELPGQFQVLQTSSRNKTGRNGDANWVLYKDKRGDGVIFEAAGPGCVRSMWGTSFDPAGIMKFYFDGEREPRYALKVIDFYSAGMPPSRRRFRPTSRAATGTASSPPAIASSRYRSPSR